jgi:chromosome partitioning protein
MYSKVISVFNQKGGVGKTTTAVNLCAALAKAKKKTLLADIDPQGNATSGLGIDKKLSKLYKVLIGMESSENAVVSTEYDNLFVIPSNEDMAGLEVELATIQNWEPVLKDIIDPLRKDYDYIIIDAPPSLGILSMMALVASDRILIPIQCEYYALEGVSQLYSTYTKIKKKLNPELEIEGVLLTMYDSRTNLSQSVLEEAKNFFKEKVFETYIPRNVRLAEAPSFGQPVIHYDPSSSGSIAYKKLCKELLQRGEKNV